MLIEHCIVPLYEEIDKRINKEVSSLLKSMAQHSHRNLHVYNVTEMYALR